MPSSNMQYYVRTEDGHEYGPAEQDVLIQWARSGRVTNTCMIRNSLVKKWAPAKKVPFLEGIVQDGNAPTRDEKKLGGVAAMQPKSAVYSLNRPGKFKYVAADTSLRFGAWAFDMVIIGLVWGLLFVAIASAIDNGLDGFLGFTILTVLLAAVFLGYYALMMGLSAQTVGQWFWGIMVVRPNGDPVLVGRAFMFALMQIAVGWTSLLFVFVLPSRAALQDLICGIRVSRITIRDIAQASV